RVDAPVLAEALAQPRRGAEDAARATDVLTHHEHALVAGELDVEGVVHRFHEEQRAHASQPSRRFGGGTTYALSKTSSGSGSGSASAAVIPCRIVSSASFLISSASASS